MKFRIKILVAAVIFSVLFLLCLHIFINIKGKSLVVAKLQETFGRKTKIDSLTTSFPATIHIKGIEVESLFRIDEVVAGGGLFDIFRKTFRMPVLNIIRPVVLLDKGLIQLPAKDSPVPIPTFISSDSDLQKKMDNKATALNLNPMDITGGKFLFPRFYINHLLISDATLNFIDRSVGNGGISIKVWHLNMKVNNLNFINRGQQITSFDLKGKIPWGDGKEEGGIELEGWINLFKKDMQATLKVENIDGIYLYPYYANWVDLEKARIEKARLNFTSNINGLNNDVTAQCRLELADIVRRPLTEGESAKKASRITDAVLDIFRSLNQGKIVLDFTIKTKMDRPEFGFTSIKTAFEDKIAQRKKGTAFQTEDVLRLPGTLIEGTFKGATDLTRAMIEGAVSVGKEIKHAVEDKLTKEKKD